MAAIELFGRMYSDGTLIGVSVSAYQEVDPVTGAILDTTLNVATALEGMPIAAEDRIRHQGTASPQEIFAELDATLSAAGMTGMACVWNAGHLDGRERGGIVARALGLDSPGKVSTLHACWAVPGTAVAVGRASATFPGGASVACCGFGDGQSTPLAGDASTVLGWLRG